MTTITPEPPATVGVPDLAAQVAKLREIVGRMTPGEWQSNGSHFYTADSERMLVGQCRYPMGDKSNDIDGIVALRNTALPIIDAQAAEIARLREALDWAVAEIEGRTRYTSNNLYEADEQRQNAINCARAALAQVQP